MYGLWNVYALTIRREPFESGATNTKPIQKAAEKSGMINRIKGSRDYRALNSKTVKDSFPLPSLSQCLDQLCKNSYFSTLAIPSGYWQIEILDKTGIELLLS